MSDHLSYSRPESANTPMMTVPAVMEWIDMEISDLKDMHAAESHPTLQLILKGTWLYLDVMKARLADTALAQLDGTSK